MKILQILRGMNEVKTEHHIIGTTEEGAYWICVCGQRFRHLNEELLAHYRENPANDFY